MGQTQEVSMLDQKKGVCLLVLPFLEKKQQNATRSLITKRQAKKTAVHQGESLLTEKLFFLAGQHSFFVIVVYFE